MVVVEVFWQEGVGVVVVEGADHQMAEEDEELDR